MMSEPNVERPRLPSADLVQYRFDQLDETMKAFDVKLERLITGGITRADVLEMRAANDKRVSALELKVDSIEAETDRVKGGITTLKAFVAIITAVGVVIGALWWVKG